MTYRLSELDNEKQDSVRFRFRYFQEIKENLLSLRILA